MEPKVSVIIPVYNVELYLKQCIDSVLSQEYKNIEIILIDDGSTDNSGVICDDYEKKYNNIIVKHQQNQGLSGARNSGTKLATGEYIAFLDSDDWVNKKYISHQVFLLKKYNADIVIMRQQYVWGNNAPIECDKEHIEVFSKEKAIEELCYGYRIKDSACKLYKAELIKRHPFPIGVLYEDVATMYLIFHETSKIVYSNLPYYYYRRRESSITNDKFNDKHLIIIKHIKNREVFIMQYYPALMKAAKYSCAAMSSEMCRRFYNSMDMELFESLQKIVKDNLGYIIVNSKAKLKFKIRALSVCLGYRIATSEFRLEEQIKKYRKLYNSN